MASSKIFVGLGDLGVPWAEFPTTSEGGGNILSTQGKCNLSLFFVLWCKYSRHVKITKLNSLKNYWPDTFLLYFIPPWGTFLNKSCLQGIFQIGDREQHLYLFRLTCPLYRYWYKFISPCWLSKAKCFCWLHLFLGLTLPGCTTESCENRNLVSASKSSGIEVPCMWKNYLSLVFTELWSPKHLGCGYDSFGSLCII